MTPRKLGSDGPPNRGNAGKGRRKGVPNKITATAREMTMGALHDAGGRAYLTEQARENPAAFLTLVGKVLPKELALPDAAAALYSGVEIVLVSPEQRRTRIIEHEGGGG